MKFSFENLGPISHGDLELANLTVVCGMNNTGKTYLTYTIYGFLQNWRQFIQFQRGLSRTLSIPLEFDLVKLAENAVMYVNAGVDRYVTSIPGVFGSSEERFQNTSMRITLPDLPDILDIEYVNVLTHGDRRSYISIEKRKGESIVRFSTTTDKSVILSPMTLQRIITDELQTILLQKVFPRVFIVSTERTGAVTFRNELNLTKNRLIEAAQQVKADDPANTRHLLEMLHTSSYPLPVRDNVDFLNSVANVTRNKSFLSEQHADVLDEFDDLIGGDYRVNPQTNELTFQPQRVKGVRLRMGESSSAVRSLVMLGFYLRHVAARGDMLMIDEPELNLHPSNQRRLARLIARISNLGIRVFITSHSDYIIREFNNLIILKGLGERGLGIMKKYGYKSDELIDCDVFRLYTLELGRFKGPGDIRTPKSEKVKLSAANVSQREGLESTTFDETIANMNMVFSELISTDTDGNQNSD